MNNCRRMAETWTSYMCLEEEDKLQKICEKASTLIVMPASTEIFEVISHNKVTVDLSRRTCTCRAWDVLRIPCKHACAAITFMRRDVYQYTDWFMSVEAFKRSYAHIIYPIPDYDMPTFTPDSVEILPPITKRRRGRSKTRRINNRSQNTRPVTCSWCHIQGHNRSICAEPVQD
jgi:hypothetical protein